MNIIWGAMILLSIAVSFVTGRTEETVNAVFEGASTAVSTIISFAGVMCFWTGIMKLAEKSGIADFIGVVLSPVVKRLFPSSGENARRYITMNMTANILGMGNAATPMGMMAAEELDKENENPLYPSYNMCMLVVLNTTSFQLIPSTIISLRAAAGSADAVSIILPIWIASLFAVFMGVAAVRILLGRNSKLCDMLTDKET